MKKKRKPKRRDLAIDELLAIVERARPSLNEDDHETLKAAVDTLGHLTRELEAKGTSIKRLREMHARSFPRRSKATRP